MGMVFLARALQPDELRAVLADPESIEDLLWEEDFDDDDEDDDPDASGERASGLAPDPERTVDLDKSWHGVHFLLTGTDWDASTPLGMAVLGGRPVGEDLGYGPPRLLEAAEVQAVAQALAQVDQDTLARDYAPARFVQADIYPQIWDEEDVLVEYLLPNLRKLTDFYARASAREEAVVLALT